MVLVADVPLDTPEELAAKRFTYARAPSLGAPSDLSDRPSNAILQHPELPQKRTHSSIVAPEQHQQATPHVPLFSRRQHQLSEMTKASRFIDNESRAAKMNFIDLVPGTSPTAASFVSGPLDALVTHSDAQLVEEGNEDSSAVKLFKRPRKEGANDKPTHSKKRTSSKNSTAPLTTTADDIQPTQSFISPQFDQDAAQCIALVKSTVATRKESELKLQQRVSRASCLRMSLGPLIGMMNMMPCPRKSLSKSSN
ncbi:hypothetical protein FA10DRAFT_183499 [Acaromyces ingoldii]|uniref:Uncharacterized protein n=1 Tax=Acaromyces ingoldii TaxID=215250 RepID=A0A316YGW9_9BASI|nr:hypothetical protein FA10DRAFT_183499 [Acaromyces ingoldii]PWN87353.1 hypothetical protein FA10DRAFT_183499 [Acaromyces ingoldii]